MKPRTAALVVPGDINTLTGGYLYDRRLLEGLRATGRDVSLVELGASFPDPTPGDIADAGAQLAAIEQERPVLIDGLALGAIPLTEVAGMRAPLVAMIHHPLAHEGGLTPARRDYLFRTERDNLARAAHVIVTSPHTENVLTAEYGVPAARITVARPGTDRPTLVRRPTDPPLILSVGIRVRRKGHDVLLRALERIAAWPWRAVIVGGIHDADHAAALDALQTELGLGSRVRFAGRVPHGELDALYAEAAIFALATRYEGYGMVFNDAMAYGLPVVTCRTGAVPQTVPCQAGLLVPPDDPTAFAGALEEVLSNTALRAGMQRASARAGNSLGSWEDTALRVGEVLDQICQRA